MRRSFLPIMAWFCLVLCSSVVALRLRSYRLYDTVIAFRENYTIALTSGDGTLRVLFMRNYKGPNAEHVEPQIRYWNNTPLVWGGMRGSMGVAEYQKYLRYGLAFDLNNRLKKDSYGRPYYSGYRFYLSDWFIMFGFLITPAVWLLRWNRKRRRRAPGLCIVCGYDLRATPNRCPECGTVPEVGETYKAG